jgi:predicted ribosome quality control (RQC) complex YloA/Tae2 family protein
MAFDATTTAAVADELRERLLQGRVDKIVQPSALAVALMLRAAGANHWLLLSADPRHARIGLSAERLARAFDEPSPFVMALRKYLEGARLDEVIQPGHDRILRLRFRTHGAQVSLIGEVMGKHSNIILVDDKDTTLGAVKLISASVNRYRVILPRHAYVPPPPPMQPPPHADRPKLDPLTVGPRDVISALEDLSAVLTLADGLVAALAGVSPQLGREVAYRVAGDASASLQGADMPAVLETLRALMVPLAWQPSIVYRDGGVAGWAAYPLLQYGAEPHFYPSISAVLDEVYGRLESRDALEPIRAGLRAVVEGYRARLGKKAQSLRGGLRERGEIDTLRRQGEMVLAFAHSIEPGQTVLHIEEGSDEPLTISLDPALSPAENAQRLFQRYRKSRDAAAKIPPLLEEAEDELAFLDEALVYIEQADSAQALKEVKDDLLAAGYSLPGERAQPPRQVKARGGAYHPGGKQAPRKTASPALRFTTSDGLEVLVGRSARQNEVVTFDLASGGDLWFHARGMPGSHVVLKSAGRTPPDRSIEQAASLAAYYSRGRQSTTVPVDVVPARQVRRVKGGKPGLVRISGEMTVNVRPQGLGDRR